MLPEVWVVIPTRNRWSALDSTLVGALAQEGVSVEVLLVDDGSNEKVPERLDGRLDPRVRVLRHASRRGIAAARNTGLEAAGAPWVAFLDDDDLWAPNKLALQLDAMQAAKADFCYAAAVVVDPSHAVLDIQMPPHPRRLLRRLLTLNRMPAPGSNVVVRTELVRALGGFDTTFHHLADWDMWLRVASSGTAASCPEILIAYLQHPGNLHLSEEGDQPAELERLALKHASLSEREGVEFKHEVFGRWLAWRQQQAGRRLAALRLFLANEMKHPTKSSFGYGLGFLFGNQDVVFGRRGKAAPPSPPQWLERYDSRECAQPDSLWLETAD